MGKTPPCHPAAVEFGYIESLCRLRLTAYGMSMPRASTPHASVSARPMQLLFCLSLIGCHAADAPLPENAGDTPAPAPTLTFEAEPASGVLGSHFSLVWSSQGLAQCQASEDWSGAREVSGNETVTPSAPGSYRYQLNCSGTGGALSEIVSIQVIAPPPTPVSVSLSLTPATAGLNQVAALIWASEGATGCTASGAWSGSLPPSGNRTVQFDSPGAYPLKLRCEGPGGAATDEQTLTVLPAPTLQLQSSAQQADAPAVVLLSWSSTDAQGCQASDDWSGARATAGQEERRLETPGSYRFSLSCDGLSGTVTQQQVITVLDPNAEAKALFEARRRIRDAAMP